MGRAPFVHEGEEAHVLCGVRVPCCVRVRAVERLPPPDRVGTRLPSQPPTLLVFRVSVDTRVPESDQACYPSPSAWTWSD
jgi:hypothetical protein